MKSSKLCRRNADATAQCRCEMARAAETNPGGNLGNRDIWPLQKELLRSCQALSHDVGMGRFPNSLFKGPFEMADANPSKSGKLVKGNDAAKMLVDIFDDILETVSRQTTGASKWLSRYRGICMDDMMS